MRSFVYLGRLAPIQQSLDVAGIGLGLYAHRDLTTWLLIGRFTFIEIVSTLIPNSITLKYITGGTYLMNKEEKIRERF